ncbi:hypothetical protein K8B83_14925 [Shewanella inventionis]|uniref:hypothetical protein n=1 Tax=Shewanella inventionis TaxID=1738770 RepID=UPI001CBB5A5E|nr:hypothetical protein [Shewanella inventionis]UAL42167.1 hypothetical protein K8B83_14925 [Shewanella inventionis]
MNIHQLINLDMGEAVDWLISNSNDYALVPRTPTEDMCEAFHDAQDEWENGGIESPDHQWSAMINSHENGGSV